MTNITKIKTFTNFEEAQQNYNKAKEGSKEIFSKIYLAYSSESKSWSIKNLNLIQRLLRYLGFCYQNTYYRNVFPEHSIVFVSSTTEKNDNVDNPKPSEKKDKDSIIKEFSDSLNKIQRELDHEIMNSKKSFHELYNDWQAAKSKDIQDILDNANNMLNNNPSDTFELDKTISDCKHMRMPIQKPDKKTTISPQKEISSRYLNEYLEKTTADEIINYMTTPYGSLNNPT